MYEYMDHSEAFAKPYKLRYYKPDITHTMRELAPVPMLQSQSSPSLPTLFVYIARHIFQSEKLQCFPGMSSTFVSQHISNLLCKLCKC